MPAAAPPRSFLLAYLGAAWVLASSLYSPSATRLDVWPWAAIASAGWLALAAGALGLFASGRLAPPRSPLAIGLALWGIVVTVSAWRYGASW